MSGGVVTMSLRVCSAPWVRDRAQSESGGVSLMLMRFADLSAYVTNVHRTRSVLT